MLKKRCPILWRRRSLPATETPIASNLCLLVYETKDFRYAIIKRRFADLFTIFYFKAIARMEAVKRVICFLCHTLFSLRYRVEVKGLSCINPKGGTLFLANHASRLDPILIFLALFPRFQIRPIVVEYIYRLKALKPFLKLLKAIPIPNFDTAVNEYKVRKTKEAMDQVIEGLRQGDFFLLYPSGRLKRKSEETIGGVSAVHTLLQSCPDVNIVLIRITGLWGSLFSYGFDEKMPDLSYGIKRGIGSILKSGIFFTPRRKVLIEIENVPLEFPRKGKRLEVNRYLENWFNKKQDPLKRIPYTLWSDPSTCTPDHLDEKSAAKEKICISENTRVAVYQEINRILKQPNIQIFPEMNLSIDLGMDSIDIAELFAFLSRHMKVKGGLFEGIETVQDVLEMAEGKVEMPPIAPIPSYFPTEKNRPSLQFPRGSTIPAAFLDVCQRMSPFSSLADPFLGVISYKKIKRAVLAFAESFQSLSGQYIGVMFPASISAHITILALQFAGKTPVLLNWTLGSRYIDQMIDQTGLETVITSWNFLDKVPYANFGKATEQALFLEDLREQISLKAKWKALFSQKPPPSLKESDVAIILFTSGTENTPKGVPLTHKNLLSNLESLLSFYPFYKTDILFSALPPFHSFGYSVTGILPLLAGMRVALHSDPTDHQGIANGIAHWKATIYVTAPSFLRSLLLIAQPEQLETIRMFYFGSEKPPKDLPQLKEKINPKAALVEGYGITECSPCVATGRPDISQKGLGEIIPGVDILTIHPETEEILTQGVEGEMVISGPNVFGGYLGNAPSPFFHALGKRWYRSGDLGYVDAERNVHLTGRLKRFVKIGGEMISLAAVEQTLTAEFQDRLAVEPPIFVVCAKEIESGNPHLIVFCKIELDNITANNILKRHGFSPLVKIRATYFRSEFPIMANGKIDYRQLQA